MKKCTKCKIEKELEDFHKDRKRTDGLTGWCKLCHKRHAKLKYTKRPPKENANIEIEGIIYKKCPKCSKRKTLEEFNKHKNKKDGRYSYCKLCRSLFLQNNKEKVSLQRKQNYKNNKKIINERSKEYKKTHKIERNIYEKNKKTNDVEYKITCNLRSRLSKILRRKIKTGSAIKDLGCSLDFFKQYIESLFKPGMTWDNYGLYGWHLDHKMPLYHFNLIIPEEFLEACHHTNIQPLWAEDNLKKNKRIL